MAWPTETGCTTVRAATPLLFRTRTLSPCGTEGMSSGAGLRMPASVVCQPVTVADVAPSASAGSSKLGFSRAMLSAEVSPRWSRASTSSSACRCCCCTGFSGHVLPISSLFLTIFLSHSHTNTHTHTHTHTQTIHTHSRSLTFGGWYC